MDTFEKVVNKIVKQYKSISLSDLDLLKLVKNKARVMFYRDLGKYETLDQALGPYGSIFLLYEDRPNYGHWAVVWRRNRDTINFFDSYGIFPDDELEWTDDMTQEYLGQDVPYLTKLLLDSPYKHLEYNDYPYQKESEDVATCGRWAAVRLLLREISPKQFQKIFGKKNGDDLVTLITAPIL